jgi:hypothetical protein
MEEAAGSIPAQSIPFWQDGFCCRVPDSPSTFFGF